MIERTRPRPRRINRKRPRNRNVERRLVQTLACGFFGFGEFTSRQDVVPYGTRERMLTNMGVSVDFQSKSNMIAGTGSLVETISVQVGRRVGLDPVNNIRRAGYEVQRNEHQGLMSTSTCN
jgi:hypothetical protein